MRRLTVLWAALFACALAAAAGEPPPLTFTETLDVRLINLEAAVTDEEGVPIQGLAAADFRLAVDGEATSIEYLTEVRGGMAVQASPEDDFAGLPGLAAGQRVVTNYLVFIDDFFPLETDRNRVLASLAEQLPSLGAEDRMAIVAWNGRSLELLSSWSGSARALESALRRARDRPALGLQRLAERRLYEDSLAPRQRFQLSFEERAYAELLAAQVEDTVHAAAAALRAFGAPDGRKVMLLLSGGWPFEPAAFVAGTPFRTFAEPFLPHGIELFALLADTANLLGYTVYAVDLPGLAAGSFGDPSRARPRRFGLGDPELYREDEVEASLRFLADHTGGQALLNSRRTEALARAAADTRSFYWLAFTPAWVGDDEPHEITLSVDRPRVEVRARSGFSDLSPRTRVAMAVESAALFGYPANGRVLEVLLGAPRALGRNKIEVPITVKIPVATITIQPSGKHFVAQLELHVAAVDEEGGRSETTAVPVELLLAEKPQAEEVLEYQTVLRLAKRGQRVGIALYDRGSGELRSTIVPLAPVAEE